MKRSIPCVSEKSKPELDSFPNSGEEPNGGKRLRSDTEESMVEDARGMDGDSEFASVDEAFDALVKQYAERPAVEDESGAAWTYAELQAASLRVAAGMNDYRVQDQSRSNGWPAPVALLMKRSNAWVASCIAAMRIAVPSLSLSGDLRTPEESQRNREALAEHMPFLLLLQASLRASSPQLCEQACSTSGLPSVDVEDLLTKARQSIPAGPSLIKKGLRNPDEVLYFVYTGGTTSASKCVAVTHRMALHELKCYPTIAPLQCTDRVLHQSSAYWGATSLGIFDVAWACGGCLVMSEDGAGPAEVAAVIAKAGITSIGVVPSVLEALECEQCPGLRVIFTWGEALAPKTAARWSKCAVLLDLLIASEYWLILVSDHRARFSGGCKNGDARTGFRPVPGARLTLLPPEREGVLGSRSVEVADGEVGELYFAGPMVSSVGYADHAKNRDAFVDLPVGIGGSLVRHFRTRDLACRRSDGSLEYCGRADGFAKVGGKWLDLAAVERRVVSAGCTEAALVWDERAKQRHAAVVLEKSAVAQRSLSECAAELQRLLPKDTKLHVRASLPHNAATGKLHRGRLVEELAAEAATPSSIPRAAESGVRKATRSLLCGLLLAGRAGARGALAASLAWGLAPGMTSNKCGTPPALEGLPEGLVESVRNWAAWHRASTRSLSGFALRALPHIAVLLVDADDTGLEELLRFFSDGPIGLLGLAMMVSQHASPLIRWLLVAAGKVHARRARGGVGWAWAFWIAWPYNAAQWESDCWHAIQGCRSKSLAVCSEMFLRSARSILAERSKTRTTGPLPSLRSCYQCGEWVPHGEHWRKQFYCSKCNEQWEKYMAGDESALPDDIPMPDTGRWNDERKREPKWLPGLSEIDFTEVEVQRARGLIPLRVHQSPNPAKVSSATPVGRIVERCSGIDASDPSASLGGLESLKIIAVVSALRRELGYALQAKDVTRCGTVGELEELCAQAKVKVAQFDKDVSNAGEELNGSESAWGILAIPRFWRAPVGWLIRLDEVPQEHAMRAAACALVKRHPGLRACPYSKPGDEYLADMCIRSAAVVIVMNKLIGGYAKGFLAKVSQGFCAAWPKVVVSPPKKGVMPAPGTEMCNFEWLRFTTMSELRSAAWLRARSRGFKTPAQMAVLILSGSGNSNGSSGDRAYLHVAVNHAVCDAFCIVPLMADLLALQAAAIEASTADPPPANLGILSDKALENANLPKAPNGCAVQEERLKTALDPIQQGADAQDICQNVFCPRRRGVDYYVRMKAGATAMLEAGSSIIGIPPDHLLVAAIASAFACITNQLEVKLSLIVPMRDGEGEGQIISNLASTRHMDLWFGKRSFLAVALDLSQRLRRREWYLCDFVGDDGDRLFVNIRDLPRFEGGASVMEDVDTQKSTTNFVRNIMEMFVDRESETSWAFSIGIRNDLDGHMFAEALQKILWTSAVEPMGAAIPVLSTDVASSAQAIGLCTKRPASVM